MKQRINTRNVEWAGFELPSGDSKQRSEVEVEGYKTKGNSHYYPEPQLGSFVQDQ